MPPADAQSPEDPSGGRAREPNPNKSESIQGFTLAADQRADLIAFLQSLTDEELFGDDRFADPWPAGARRQGARGAMLASHRPRNCPVCRPIGVGVS